MCRSRKEDRLREACVVEGKSGEGSEPCGGNASLQGHRHRRYEHRHHTVLTKGQALPVCSLMLRNLPEVTKPGSGRAGRSGSRAPESVCLTTALACFPDSCSSHCVRLPVPPCVDGGGRVTKGVLGVRRITRSPVTWVSHPCPTSWVISRIHTSWY